MVEGLTEHPWANVPHFANDYWHIAREMTLAEAIEWVEYLEDPTQSHLCACATTRGCCVTRSAVAMELKRTAHIAVKLVQDAMAQLVMRHLR